jgi:hypothetical protein
MPVKVKHDQLLTMVEGLNRLLPGDVQAPLLQLNTTYVLPLLCVLGFSARLAMPC